MKLVVLDSCLAAQDDLDFDVLKEFGELIVYYDTKNPDDVFDRIVDADVIIECRVKIGKEQMDHAKNLKLICTVATGYNLIDVKYAREKGIVVSNIPAYSSYLVAQSTVAFMLEYANKIAPYNRYVKEEKWTRFDNAEMWDIKNIELLGKTVGIIGMGDIGYKVAKICECMGMNVLGYRRTPDLSMETDNIKFASLDEIYANSDIISLHCPLTDDTTDLINKDTIAKMKDGVMIINTSRGYVVKDDDMIVALDQGKVCLFCADVTRNEPPLATDKLHLHPKSIVTPHVAWAAKDTRLRAIMQVYGNVKAFVEGSPTNVVS